MLTYQCSERRPSRSGMGWHKHCHISSQRHTGNISRVSIHSCVDQAIAIVGHRQHEENLFAPQPKAQRGRSNETGSVFSYNKKELNIKPTCRRPSKVLCMVTHLLGWAPFVVMAVIRESSSSFFSFSFLTRLSIARLAKLSLSPPCRWHIRLCTMLRQASLLVGVFVIDILLLRFQP